jgi:hypothetical protein
MFVHSMSTAICDARLTVRQNVVTYSFGFFLPIILRSEMGFSIAMSQVLSFPPYVFAAIVCPPDPDDMLRLTFLIVDVHNCLHWRPL